MRQWQFPREEGGLAGGPYGGGSHCGSPPQPSSHCGGSAQCGGGPRQPIHYGGDSQRGGGPARRGGDSNCCGRRPVAVATRAAQPMAVAVPPRQQPRRSSELMAFLRRHGMHAVSDVLDGRNSLHRTVEDATREPMLGVAKQPMAAVGPARQSMLKGQPVSAEWPRGWMSTHLAAAGKAAYAASSQRRGLLQLLLDQRADPIVSASAFPPAHAVLPLLVSVCSQTRDLLVCGGLVAGLLANW